MITRAMGSAKSRPSPCFHTGFTNMPTRTRQTHPICKA